MWNERTVRTSRGAAIGVVTELMNMHSSLGIGVVAGDLPADGGGGGLGGLLKGHGAFDIGVSS